MRKFFLIVAVMLVLIISVMIIMWQNYELSSDYNYFTAKLDIKKGDVKIVNMGVPIISSKDKEIEMVAAKYGFKNIYIKPGISKKQIKEIDNYNKVIETYLTLRNGVSWKTRYQREVDSLLKLAFQ